MYIDKIYLFIVLELFFIYFVVSIILIKSSKFYALMQEIFNEIKQNKEMELIKANQRSLNKNIKLKKMAYNLLKQSPSNNAKHIAQLMNEILEKNEFSVHNFNHYEREYIAIADLLKTYKELHNKSDNNLKKIISSTKEKLENLQNLYERQLQSQKEKNAKLLDEVTSLKDDISDKIDVDVHNSKVADLEKTIKNLENLMKEYENSQETLEYELQREKEKNEDSERDLYSNQEELDKLESYIDLNGLNNELNIMLEKLILDQEELINKINEQAVIIEELKSNL